MEIAPLFAAEAVRARIAELAAQLARDYAHSPLTLVCILEGARRFADALSEALARHRIAAERIDVRARRTRGMRLEPVEIEGFEPDRLAGRDVLVLDDIADEGATLRAVLDIAALGEPRSLRCAVLVDKRERRRAAVTPDYAGFVVESGWVIGFGMDLDGAFRELDYIGVVRDERF
ncbi:MAG TPA: phosphoribosyltransferase family protein [Myxococcota bacterium]|nr:phosphoribosyltransferase family protein [Myxococcota bacterium]